ncbi:MAG: histidine kinase [Pseudomonadales bacterium]|nr:histidine kinase [Pseudomonadales bacterium]
MANSSDFKRLAPGVLRPGGLLQSYAHTLLFCAAIALCLWLLEIASPLWVSAVISFSIGLCVNSAVTLAFLFSRSRLPISLSLLVATPAGIAAGLIIAGLIIEADALLFFGKDYRGIILGLFFGVLGYLFFHTRERLTLAHGELESTRAQQLAADRQHFETQLRLLQAQIEPHFLFNTLSNIVSMIRPEPEAAERALLDLTRLLRVTLKRTRQTVTRLGDELEVVRALLHINQIRMGARLRYTIDVADDLLDLPLPPMILQPLVENAIRHGIEPLEAGGEVHIRCDRMQDTFTVQVSDSGVGNPGGSGMQPASLDLFSTGESRGTGIANVQARLLALYGSRARLDLREGQHGMIALMTLPCELPNQTAASTSGRETLTTGS